MAGPKKKKFKIQHGWHMLKNFKVIWVEVQLQKKKIFFFFLKKKTKLTWLEPKVGIPEK